MVITIFLIKNYFMVSKIKINFKRLIFAIIGILIFRNSMNYCGSLDFLNTSKIEVIPLLKKKL